MQCLPVSGTLVVMITSRDGFVIVADKRTCDKVRGDVDTSVKITPLGRMAAITSTGNVCFMRAYTNSLAPDAVILTTEYDATSIIARYNESSPLTFPDGAQTVANLLVSGFQSYLSRIQSSEVPDEPADKVLYRLYIVTCDNTQQPYKVYNFGFNYQKSPLACWVNWECRYYGSSAAIVLGNIAVDTVVRTGQDTRFDDLRSNPQVQRFIFQGLPISEVSGEEAVEFAKFYIRQCSERTPLIDNSTFHIGPTVDVAMIDKVNGFRWLEGGV